MSNPQKRRIYISYAGEGSITGSSYGWITGRLTARKMEELTKDLSEQNDGLQIVILNIIFLEEMVK